ncbi:MAG: FadR family transcriptional regulator [Chloroflexia bacterium]|nr:FadR family transcriptional regulator [Chloroflexia bacterium]
MVSEPTGRPGLTERELEAVPRVSVHEEIRDRLRRFIIDSGLAPGDRLPGEAAIALRLGVGRPAVREALRSLEAVGAIATRQGVGRFVGRFEPASYVRNFTTESLVEAFDERELMETRCLLEIAAVPAAVRRLTDADLAELGAYLVEMRRLVAAGEPYLEADLGMHRVMMRHVDNRLIAVMLDVTYALASRWAGQPEWEDRAGREATRRVDLAEHEALAAAVLRRDGAAAQARLIDHFGTTAKRAGFTLFWDQIGK